MKIIVPVKRVVDANIRVHVRQDHTGVDTSNVKMSMNPFCEIAVEAAVRLKESGLAGEIVAVSIGDTHSQDVLRTAMAMGADRGILVQTAPGLHPLSIARLLAYVVTTESAMMVIMGKQSIDGDNNQTGQMLAGLLGWPQGTFVSAINLRGDRVEVTREIDGGLETLSLSLPAVITTDLRLNEPRYLKLPEIIRARKKNLDVIDAAATGVDTESGLKVLEIREPPGRHRGIMLGSVAELVERLREETGVI